MNGEIIDKRPKTREQAWYRLIKLGVSDPTERQITVMLLLGKVVEA